jgi:hypothetical protein
MGVTALVWVWVTAQYAVSAAELQSLWSTASVKLQTFQNIADICHSQHYASEAIKKYQNIHMCSPQNGCSKPKEIKVISNVNMSSKVGKRRGEEDVEEEDEDILKYLDSISMP